jgi:hypothetical protein
MIMANTFLVCLIYDFDVKEAWFSVFVLMYLTDVEQPENPVRMIAMWIFLTLIAVQIAKLI